MWDQRWQQSTDDKPRLSIDKITPIINDIWGELSQADFAIQVDPAGGQSTEDDAKNMAGLIRNIENISDAGTKVYDMAAKSAIKAGIGGWRVVQKYVDSDSFDQDLVIEWLSNFEDRVWFGDESEQPDASDAKRCWVMHAFTPEDYEANWPKGKGNSLGADKTANAYFHRAEVIVVGEYYYIQEEQRTLVLFSNGAVHEDNEDLQKVTDELAQLNVTEVSRRTRKKNCVYVRKFDGDDWLEEPKKTVFTHIPVVPEYANFDVVDGKLVWYGEVEKKMDSNRIYNYGASRMAEDVALQPRDKYMVTPTQVRGHEQTFASMNTNLDAYQMYNPDPDAPGPPQKTPASIVNPGIKDVMLMANNDITQSAGLFEASMGNNPNDQSGVAIKALQNKGDTGTLAYTRAHEIAICQTFRILAGAIPNVYKGERQQRILNEDGTTEVVTLNQEIIDQQTGERVTLNDLSKGIYKITCKAGPARS
jgi:hypothetical protein